MASAEILEHEHREIILEDQIRHLADEHRFRVPGCGYDCEGGWHEVALHEYGPLDLIPLPDPAVIVLPWGLILSACECNSGAGGRVRRWPEWYGA